MLALAGCSFHSKSIVFVHLGSERQVLANAALSGSW